MLACFVKSKSSLTNSCFNGFVSSSLYLVVVREESGLEISQRSPNTWRQCQGLRYPYMSRVLPQHHPQIQFKYVFGIILPVECIILSYCVITELRGSWKVWR